MLTRESHSFHCGGFVMGSIEADDCECPSSVYATCQI
jgi:hypothetical protein